MKRMNSEHATADRSTLASEGQLVRRVRRSRLARVLGAAVCALGLAAGVRADVVDFEGAATPTPELPTILGYGPLAGTGYAGFVWSANAHAYQRSPSQPIGLTYNISSGEKGLYTAFAGPVTISRPTRWTFVGARMTAAWNTPDSFRITASRAGAVVYDQTRTLAGPASPATLSFNFTDIDSVTITPLGSTIAIDDLEWNNYDDCNGNGILDATDIANGTSTDCDGNGVLDSCQPRVTDTAGVVQWSASSGGNGHWYWVSPTATTWSAANAAAAAKGGHLVTITSAAEQSFVATRSAGNIHLGGLQFAGSCEPACAWQWVTGEPFSYAIWNAGEPNNGNGAFEEDQLMMTVGGAWNDASASAVLRYVIEWDSEPAFDLNGNGVFDRCDLASHTASDCNGNGLIDSADIASGAELDLNADGFPDSCQSAIVSWGDNFYGQRNTPSGIGFVSAIDGGAVHTVALRGNGTVVCWGDNSVGQCSPPAGLANVVAISANNAHTVATKSDGTVVCWGFNQYGAVNPPVGLSGVVAVAAGGDHALALRSTGQVVGWGSNIDHEDTGNTIGQATTPPDLVSATAIGAGHQHSLAVRPDGTVRCFGWNMDGQCQPPAGLGGVTRVAGGWAHSLALKSDGTVVAWGGNYNGQLDVPVGLNSVTAIAVKNEHNVALRADGTVVSWGANFVGQATVPSGLDRVRSIGAGDGFSFSVRQQLPAPTAVLVSSTPTTCGLSNGAIDVSVTDAPILSWTGPSGFVSTAEDLTNLAAGIYTLTARGPGGSSTLSVTVAATPDMAAPVITGYTANASAAANAACTAVVPNFTSSVVATDNCTIASITQTPLAGASVGLGAHEVTIRVTDASGNNAAVTAVFTVTGNSATYYADGDVDGYGAGAATASCAAIAGSVTNNTDCNDASSAIHPGASELCNGLDDDCVGGADNGLAFTNYYADADHDGFGTGSPITACSQPANSATVAGDQCDNDPLKQAPGTCGCGSPDTDANGNGIADCADVYLVLTPSATSVSSGGQFRVRVSASSSLAPMAGLQLAMRYDHAYLRLDTVEPVAGGPFEAELAKQIDNTAGTLRYAIGVADGASGLTSAADLCDLQFTVLPGTSLCGSSVLVTFGNVGPFTTRFTRMTGGAQVPLVASLPPINLDSVAPVLSGVPSSVSVAADAGSTYGAYVAAPTVTATDDCDGAVAVDGPTWPSDGMFPIGTTTLTWSATDSAGNTSSETRTITVGDYQLLDASIAFQGSLSGTSTRSVRIKAGASSQVLTVDLTGSSGTLAGVQVPVAASYACIEAKDTVHTLTRTAAPSIAGTRYSASFLLVQGDSNDDDLVDIVDFGSFVADRGAGKAKDARSNFNADTLVNNADFTYITLNFFSVGESCTGALDGAQPRDRIHVKELRRMGRGDLAAADLNGDGWVDTRDMQSYMQGGGGAAPRPQAADAPPAAVGGGW